jgi:hypothetical protein
MIPTFYGAIIVLVGAWLLFTGTTMAMLAFVTACSLFGGGAAFILTALGGSSIPPSYFALGFLILRVVAPGAGTYAEIPKAIQRNIVFVGFCLYSSVTAFILPKLFVGKISVAALHTGRLANLYQTQPLHMTSQNLTTAVYLMGGLLFAIVAGVAATRPRAARIFVLTACVLIWVHTGCGFLGQFVDLGFLRNGSYAQLDQEAAGFVRITGLFPEPSAFAGYGFVWLVFACELWLRDVRPRLTGPAALALALILFASTSSTAYVGFAGYSVVLAARWLLFPHTLRQRKAIAFVALAWLALAAVLVAMVLSPKLADNLGVMLDHMTVGKLDSASGRQRLFWAKQGFDAFAVSHGLGIGAGSFRSSSLLTAILGSSGVVGLVLFLAHLLVVLQPWRASTFCATKSETEAVGVAAAWTVIVGSVPSFVSHPSADPGLLFALFSGLAVTWRSVGVGASISKPIRVKSAAAARAVQRPAVG